MRYSTKENIFYGCIAGIILGFVLWFAIVCTVLNFRSDAREERDLLIKERESLEEAAMDEKQHRLRERQQQFLERREDANR